MTPRPVGVIGGTTVAAGKWPEVCWSSGQSGVLISPNMVLTNAHSTPSKFTFTLPTGVVKTINVKRCFVHPGFDKAAFSLGGDIQICMLTEKIVGITPAVLCETTPTLKMAIDLVGFGHNTPTAGAGTKRSGSQVVDFVLATHIIWIFDAAEKNTFASGDSGAPCFLAGTNQIVGIQSGSSAGAGGKLGVPGTHCFAGRVDGLTRQWVLSTVALAK